MPHIYSQLINAQFENSSGAPSSGGTPVGRVYFDTTSTTAGIPKYYNGSNWMTFGNPLMTANTTGVAAFNTQGASETIYNNSSSTLASLTLTLPTSTSIGQTCRYVTRSAVTTITVGGGTVLFGAALTSLSANSAAVYQAVDNAGNFVRVS